MKLSNVDGTWTEKEARFDDGLRVHTNPTLAGDVNGDGKTDSIFVGQDWDDSNGLNIRVTISNGDGTWSSAKQFLGDGAVVHTNPAILGDVNSDWRDDIVFVGNYWDGSCGLNIRVMFSNGNGTWSPIRKASEI